MKIVLISCVKEKAAGRHRAKDLYVSSWFRYAFRYSQVLHPDRVFILSAKYGLVDQDSEIESYEETLRDKSKPEKQAWARRVLTDLSRQADLQRDRFVILAGDGYRKYLVPDLGHYEVPMQGLRIGEQMRWLKEACSP